MGKTEIVILSSLLVVLVLLNNPTSGQKSNCRVGRSCNKCPVGHFKTVRLGDKSVKVCCPGCSKYCMAGNRRSDGRPYCSCYYPKDIQGDCWKGEKCETCLNGPNKGYVGNINSVPVCCANCERSGLMLGPKLCNCLHNGPEIVILSSLLVVLVLLNNPTSAQKSNCRVGRSCNKCPVGHYKTVRLGAKSVKVCCPGCSKYCMAGNRRSDGRPYCSCYYPKDIQGDCWKGEKCETCLNGPNKGYVGNINSVPVCCANCERSGLMLGPKLCNCLHNGP